MLVATQNIIKETENDVQNIPGFHQHLTEEKVNLLMTRCAAITTFAFEGTPSTQVLFTVKPLWETACRP